MIDNLDLNSQMKPCEKPVYVIAMRIDLFFSFLNKKNKIL